MEDSTQLAPLPAALDPISRPSSTSTQESLAHLPGITSLASAGSGMSSPQLRAETVPSASPAPAASPIPVPAPAPETAPPAPTEPIASPAIAMAAVSSMVPPPAPPLIQAHTPQNMIPPPPTFAASSPATGSTGNLPTCQNCSTSTTPLWRRDESGAVLCNACGLFLKLHGRPRPISLKTDVIKSRNRVKTIRPDLAMKKKQNMQAAAESNGTLDPQTQASIAGAALGARRASQKSTNGHIEGLEDGQYPPNALPGFGISGTSPGRAASPLNGERLDMPQTQEQLLAANSSLKTRVAELEVINDFIQRRLAQFEQYGSGQEPHDGTGQAEAQLRSQLENVTQTEAQVRSQLEALAQTESQLRAQLEDSHRRENMLKRRLDEMELELKEAKDAVSAFESDRAAKRARIEDIKPETEELTPPETGA